MAVVTTFHYVDYDEPGRRDTKAICGARVDRYAAHHSKPNCPTCARILAERRHEEPLTVEDVFGSPSDPLKGATR